MGGNEVLAGIEKEKLIVIFRGVPTEDAADVARALADGELSLSKLPTITARMILRHILRNR